jgi:hypothetical protein
MQDLQEDDTRTGLENILGTSESKSDAAGDTHQLMQHTNLNYQPFDTHQIVGQQMASHANLQHWLNNEEGRSMRGSSRDNADGDPAKRPMYI